MVNLKGECFFCKKPLESDRRLFVTILGGTKSESCYDCPECGRYLITEEFCERLLKNQITQECLKRIKEKNKKFRQENPKLMILWKTEKSGDICNFSNFPKTFPHITQENAITL